MRVLLTNDDGINGEGLRVVADFAKRRGHHITVCAPKVEQSAKSHAINIHTPFEIKKVEYAGADVAYSVDSTPADCVRFATLGLKPNYDLVISGINRGLNMGEDVLYSGTAAAIFEACNQNLKGVAMSTRVYSFDSARAWIDKVFDFIAEKELFKYCDFLNVNVPENAKGILITKMGGPYYTDSFREISKDLWQQEGHCVHNNRHDHTIDTDATIDGYVTITPMTNNRTDYKAYEIIKNIKWENQ